MKSVFALLLACSPVFCQPMYLTGQSARLVVGQQNFTYQLYQSPPTQNVLGAPGGVAFGANTLWVVDGNVMFAALDNNRVLGYTGVSSFPTPTNIPAQYASLYGTCPVCVGSPSILLGQTSYLLANVGTTSNTFYSPSAVATDGTMLAVADTNNNRVLIWKTLPTGVNQAADIVVGQPDFTHYIAVEPPTAASLSGPQGVWIYNGALYVADTFNNRVLIYNTVPTSNGASANTVLGQASMTVNPPPPITEDVPDPTQASLASPTSVTTDGTHLFVADLGHNRVLIWNTIPTANNTNADVVLGQPDFVSDTDDNSTVLCASNGTDTNNNPTYPPLCSVTYSFPRFALSDGTRLYVADSGNDRILVYNTIPTAPPTVTTGIPDAILGEPDGLTDSPSAATDSVQSPGALAWDGTNLWVADTYNLRVVAYTPTDFSVNGQLPETAVRNAASLQIYGSGSLTLGGTPTKGDTVTLTVDSVNYVYTVTSTDTLPTIATGIANLVDGLVSGTAQDPNIIALADNSNVTDPVIIFTARVAGTPGTATTYSAAVSSSSAITIATPEPNIYINLADATQIAPGSLITIYGTGLSTGTAAGALVANPDGTNSSYPLLVAGTMVYIDGIAAHLLYVSPNQINAQMPFDFTDRSSVSVEVVRQNADGSLSPTNTIGTVIVAGNPGIFAEPGPEPRTGLVYHYSTYATGLVDVDGTINAGDVGTITINGTAYSYTVQAADTLSTVETALINEINASDANVTASAANEYTRIFFTAKQPGATGAAVTYSAAVTGSSATLTLTAFSTALCCGNAAAGLVTPSNPALPGEAVVVYVTGLGITTPATDSITGQLVTGTLNPLLTPVDSIIDGTDSGNIVSSYLVPGAVGLYQVIFQVATGLTADNLTTLTVAQVTHVSNVVTFAVGTP
jgi:uncharacterized protein (TIGR03437 family)